MPRRVLQGVVVSDKGDKTVVVRVERRVMHPVYKKYVTRSKRYAAHDADNRWHAGDAVRIEESRPISKTKHWVVAGPVGKTAAAVTAAEDEAAAKSETAAARPRRATRTSRRRAAAEGETAAGDETAAGGAQ
jgi:small subunit ribosomal protein S17